MKPDCRFQKSDNRMIKIILLERKKSKINKLNLLGIWFKFIKCKYTVKIQRTKFSFVIKSLGLCLETLDFFIQF